PPTLPHRRARRREVSRRKAPEYRTRRARCRLPGGACRPATAACASLPAERIRSSLLMDFRSCFARISSMSFLPLACSVTPSLASPLLKDRRRVPLIGVDSDILSVSPAVLRLLMSFAISADLLRATIIWQFRRIRQFIALVN